MCFVARMKTGPVRLPTGSLWGLNAYLQTYIRCSNSELLRRPSSANEGCPSGLRTCGVDADLLQPFSATFSVHALHPKAHLPQPGQLYCVLDGQRQCALEHADDEGAPAVAGPSRQQRMLRSLGGDVAITRRG